MKNQYMWLYHNLNRYKYITDQAKKLQEEYARKYEEAESKDVITDELIQCYDKFVSLFNNNIGTYASSLFSENIEAFELDCYFIETARGFVPVGYYKEGRCVESVILLDEKLSEDKNGVASVETTALQNLSRRNTEILQKQAKLKEEKKPGFIRGIIHTIACLLVLWTAFVFCRIVDIVTVFKNIAAPEYMMELLNKGASTIPFVRVFPTFWLIVIFIVHIVLVVNVVKNIKPIVRELSMAYKKHCANRLQKTIKSCETKLKNSFKTSAEALYDEATIVARCGGNLSVRHNAVALAFKKLRKNKATADEYFKTPAGELRGIKKSSTIFFMLFFAILGMLTYNTGDDKSSMTIFEKPIRDIYAMTDTTFLRSKKLVQTMYNDCEMYTAPMFAAKKNETLDAWTKLELVESADGWRKVRKITGDKVIAGWVRSEMLCPYNAVTYDAFKKIKVDYITSTANFVENGFTYWPGYAIDSNRATSWRVEYGRGEKLFLTLAEPASVRVIQIFPGNSHSPQAFAKNNRIKKARIKFSDKSSVTYEFDDTFNEKYQSVWLNKPIVTDYIEIEILSVYDEYTFTDDLCVGEIHIYGDK